MRITRVHIENYRSIRELDLYPDDYTVLIGDNNAGKSNILKAMNLVLGEIWPTDRTFTLEDFYFHNSEQDIVIQVYFDTVLEKWKNMSLKVWGFELRGHAYKRAYRGNPRGTIKVDYTCIDDKGESVRYPAEPLQEGKQAKIWYDLKVSGAFKESLPFIYIDQTRDYYRQDPGNRWSALRKMFNDVNTEINHYRTIVKVLTADGEVKMTRKQAFEHKMGEAFAYLRNPALVSIEDQMKWGLEQMGFGLNDSGIALNLALADPVDAFHNLRLLADQLDNVVEAGAVGAGMQSALVIAILRAYAEIKREGAVMAIETPEILLHPSKINHFRAVLQTLSRSHQVLVITHCPEFVDISRPEEIYLVRRSALDGTKLVTCSPDQFDDGFRQEMALLDMPDSGRSRMFFARGVVLVTDAVDKLAVTLTARSLQMDFGQAGVEVIACGGKDNLLRYVELAEAFEIPAVVIAPSGSSGDEGASGSYSWSRGRTANPSNQQVNEALQQRIKGHDLFWLHPNWGALAGLQTEGSDLLKETAGYFHSHRAQELPCELVQAVGRIGWLIGHERSDRGEV